MAVNRKKRSLAGRRNGGRRDAGKKVVTENHNHNHIHVGTPGSGKTPPDDGVRSLAKKFFLAFGTLVITGTTFFINAYGNVESQSPGPRHEHICACPPKKCPPDFHVLRVSHEE